MSIQAKIKRYAQRVVTALPVPRPGPSDCYYCFIRDERGSPLGDKIGDHDHLLLHVRENYIFGSLLRNAIEANGTSPSILNRIFEGSSPDATHHLPSSIRCEVQHVLTRYLEERLL